MIAYVTEPTLSPADFIDLLKRSSLGERRPIDDAERIAEMLEHADVIVTARDEEGLLVGVSRAVSDFSYCTYLADLAVDTAWQRQGIGKRLIQKTHEATGLQTNLILIAAPAAREYYPRIGMQYHDSCWMIPGKS